MLGILGVTTPGDSGTHRLPNALRLANMLLGAAEREVIRSESDAGSGSLPPDETDVLVTAAEEDADLPTELAGERGAVLHWRAARLRRALDRNSRDDVGDDPVLAAACDAAALTAVLLGYREVRQHQFADLENAAEWTGIPERSLLAAAELQARIAHVLTRLAA